MNNEKTADLVDALSKIGMVAAAHADAAGEIAHARMRLFKAYLSEGFTEEQALELCKTLSL